MTIELGISLSAFAFGIIGLGFGLISFKRYRNCMLLLEIQSGQLKDMEKTLAESIQLFEPSVSKIADSARRIAWLETRVRQPKIAEPEVLDEFVSSGSQAALQTTNMTERRHRVLSLASRGQNAELIAATLGMLRGEVELILNLHKTV